ncbi:MAG TPA: PAS domain S-box protein [Acetobacteraceae bacterium]
MSGTIRARFDMDGRAAWLIPTALAVLLIAANGVLAFAYLHQLHRASAAVDRSLQVMLVLKQIEDLSEACGRDQRSYRLSGDAQYLNPYRRAQMDLPAKLARLRELAADDDNQIGRFYSLTAMIEQDEAELAATLTPLEARFSDGRLPPELVAGMDRTIAIEAAIGAMRQNEQNRLHDQFAATESYNAITLGTGMLIRTGAIVLVVGIIAVMFRKARRNEQLATAQADALRESELRFRRIFEESPLGIVLADPDSQRIVQANPAFCRMLGTESEQMIGSPVVDLTHVDDRAMLADAIRLGTGPVGGVEARCVTRSGAIAWASVRLTQLSGPAGRPGLLLALIEDITREKRVEAELRQAQKMEAVGLLTGGIAHDFNNLLGVIIGNVEFLIDKAPDQEQANMAREILNSALSGADLTRRLLAFARRQTLEPRRIDLNAYLPNHIAILRRLLGESVAITTTLADDLWPIRADPSQVGDALLNLAINARDAMPHGGTISVVTANVHLAEDEQDSEVAPGQYVVLAMTDSGVGMSPEVLDRAVEPFFTTKGPGAGSGLGLSMIFGFARQSGGSLRIDSEPGHGTTVRLYLPRAQGAESCEADEALDVILPQGSESVLLVDDNTEMRTVARRHLVSLGYRVSEAGSGPAALEALLAGNSFDLLLTDVVMPGGMTGYQLADAARQLRPGLKVAFTTGYSWSEAPTAEVVIHKPYRRQELAAIVRAALAV